MSKHIASFSTKAGERFRGRFDDPCLALASKMYVTASAGTLVCAITVEMSLRFVFIHILRIRYVLYLGR